jgi:hypothetical protein
MTETAQSNPAADLKTALRSNDFFHQEFKKQLSISIRFALKDLLLEDDIQFSAEKLLRFSDTIAEKFIAKIADIAPDEARKHIVFDDPNSLSNIPALTEAEIQDSEPWQPSSIKEAAAFIADQMALGYKDLLIKGHLDCEAFVTVNRDFGGKMIRNTFYLFWTPQAAESMRSIPRQKPQIVQIFHAKGITSPEDMSDIIYRTAYWMARGTMLEDNITPEYLEWLNRENA